jgi:hypothetical protein
MSEGHCGRNHGSDIIAVKEGDAMPVHNWSADYAWLFHDFHHGWIGTIKRALNGGLLPTDYYALAEQVAVGATPDVPIIRDETTPEFEPAPSGLLVAEPKTRIIETLGTPPPQKNQVAVKHASDDRTVAVIEIVSPGNKDSQHAIRSFLDNTVDLLAKWSVSQITSQFEQHSSKRR